MTFSIVARDPDGRSFGAATASKYLAVGASVPAVAAGVGALVTQAYTNVLYRESGLRMLRRGRTAARTVELLVARDAGREQRQVAVVGRLGAPAAWTGSGCSAVAGQLVGEDCAVAGNLLTGERVLEAMMDAYRAAEGSLADRLLAGLAAGDAAGGDRRGRQSAALLVASGDDVVHLRTPARVDLRVDDHPAPVGELRRLLARHALLVAEADPDSAVPLVEETATQVGALLAAVGESTGPLDERLARWAGRENLEHLVLPGAVDRALLAELGAQAAVPGGAPADVGGRVR